MSAGRLAVNEFLGGEADSLFHRPDHADLAPTELSFLEWVADGKVIASLALSEISEGRWRSPTAATFGGYFFHDRNAIGELAAFDQAVESYLSKTGAHSLEVWLPPLAHDEAWLSSMVYELTYCGYEFAQADLSYLRTVDDSPFHDKINRGSRRRLEKAEAEGVAVRRLDIERLADVHAVIAANRAERGFPLSMSLSQLEALADRFPGNVEMFGAVFAGKLVASAFCLRIAPRILQVVYWGDLSGYGYLSPVVSLADAVYAWAQSADIDIIDLGTSTVGSEPNRGLMAFKERLGFRPSLKFRMRRNFGPARTSVSMKV